MKVVPRKNRHSNGASPYTSLFLSLLIVVSGCSWKGKQNELEQVAKDWSLTIRASQIMPVYPLTEDLQPGDIFLVQIPIDRQQEIFNRSGFLPLDNHIGRILPSGFGKFYERTVHAANNLILPRDWFAPGQGVPGTSAPNSSFPTYSFAVRRGAGLNLAVPVQGVPVGLSLLASDAAQGSIVIADAKTYGIDTISLEEDTQKWASSHRSFLSNFAPSIDGQKKIKQNFVRVVSRVYLTSRVNVSLQSSKSSAGEVWGGARKPVDLLMPHAGGDVQQVSMEAYNTNLEKLNRMVEGILSKAGDTLIPGGTVKVVAASANTISLVETFPRPLVIGYLGFDFPIDQYGFLGPPIPTHAILTQQISPDGQRTPKSVVSKRSYKTIKEEAAKGQNPKAMTFLKELDALASLVPAVYPCTIYGKTGPDGALSDQFQAGSPIGVEPRNFSVVTTFREKLRHSIAALQAEPNPRPTDQAEQLQCSTQTLAELEQGLHDHQLLLRDAIDFASDLEQAGGD
ncbi:hypothetical protein COMA1_50023 [Candidatus Nitrospira nitrosa]|uniref:Uncharacterized protein n=2 Tax=Candidatus Nitrospira nitrosa TaxID=1742972 RepID=A0A0S4LNG9_9BACT|nr:hypothetical protein COMA1_50023 [Candidatus Nitrospira nitrosa]